MTYTLPRVNWTRSLATFTETAEPGDILQVDTEAKAEIAQRAMDRMGKSGIEIVLVDDGVA